MTHTTRRAARRGFTLVELLVAAALTIGIMAVIAVAFQAALRAYSDLNSVAGLAEQLRAAKATIERDLDAPHLETDDGRVVRVSDPAVAAGSWSGTAGTPHRIGYLEIFQTSPTSPVVEGNDVTTGGTSERAVNHALRFTVKRSALTAQDVFTGQLKPGSVAPATLSANTIADYTTAPNQIVARWGEVAYFLQPAPGNLMTEPDPATGTMLPLHTLYRRQRVLAPGIVQVGGAGGWNTTTQPYDYDLYPEIGVINRSGTNFLATPFDVAAGNRAPPTPIPASSPSFFGTDVLLSNVISFQVMPQFAGGASFNIAPGAGYDTSAAPGAGGKPQPTALEVRLRVYDPKTKMTRQMTIRRDL